MNLIGRKEELEILEHIYRSNQAEFLALYGRRRVGKTFLIREFFETKKDIIFFNVTGLKDGSMAEQIANIMDRIGEIFYGGAKLETKKTWKEVFKEINQAIKQQSPKKKIILFIDEIPWMATPKSKLLQNLDYFWNQYWSNNSKIKLIICGSSASWIINKIVNNRGGLHNRITENICLEPFTLCETKEYLKRQGYDFNNQNILILYLVTGGVPFYLSKIQWKDSAIAIIERLAFRKKAFFLNEFDNLFSSLFKNFEGHVNIVKILANYRYGIGKSKLLALMGADGGNSAKRLQELEDAGFIMKFKPLFHQRKGNYYRLIDEYTYFYLKWIEPIKSSLQENGLEKGHWQAMRLTPEWNSWLGYAFESVCYKHLTQIRRKLNLPPLSLPSTWRYAPIKGENKEGAQIDLLFDRRDAAITLCEIKYSEKPFVITKDYCEVLNKKMRVFKEQTRSDKQLLVSFVAANGLAENHYSNELVNGVVVLDDLFEA